MGLRKSMQRWVFVSLACLIWLAVAACSGGSGGDATGNAEQQSGSGSEQSSGQSGGQNTESSSAGEQEPLLTVKVLTNMAINPDIRTSDENEMGKYIKEKFNIVFEFLPYTGDATEQANLMLATGDYPDMINLSGADMVRKYAEAGAAINLEQYFDVAPNFLTAFEHQIPLWRLYTSDGGIYHWEAGVGGDITAGMPAFPTDITIRSDALEKQNWPNVLKEDDFIAFLKQAKADFPEINGQPTVGITLPLSEPWGMQGIAGIGYEKGEQYPATAGNNAVIWDVKNQQFVDYFLNEKVKESLAFFNKLHREGLLDPEAFTDKYPQTVDKLKSGKALSVWYAGWAGPEANSGFEAAGNAQMKYISLPFQLNSQAEAGEKRVYALSQTFPFDSAIITNKAKDPERIMKFINWTLSEEGQIWRQSGIEGFTYTIENGKRVITDEYKQNWGNFDWKKTVGLAFEYRFLPSTPGLAGDGQRFNLDSPELQLEIGDARQMEAMQQLGIENYVEDSIVNTPVDLVGSITPDPQSAPGRLQTRLVDFRVKASADLILANSAEEFENIYKKAVEDYNKLSPEIVVDEYNKLYQEALN